MSIITSMGMVRDCWAWGVRSFGMARAYVIIEGDAKDASWVRRGSGKRGVGVHSEQADTR